MSKCSFSIDFTGTPDDLIKKAESAILNAGGRFNGDTSSGGFIISTPIGQVSGSYAVENQNFFIEIKDKPFLLTCNRIETELRQYVKGS